LNGIIMSGMPSADFLSAIEAKGQAADRAAEGILLTAKAEHRSHLNEGEQRRYEAALADYEGLSERRAKEYRADLERSNLPPHLARLGGGSTESRGGVRINTAGQLAPLHFGDEELRKLQGAAMRNEPCRVEARSPMMGMEQRDPGFSTADSLLPPSLFPFPIEWIHESRLLDKLAGYAIDTPAVTFIRHISSTGAAAPVAEGSDQAGSRLQHRRPDRRGGEAGRQQRSVLGNHL
jgi:hypothetical protein